MNRAHRPMTHILSALVLMMGTSALAQTGQTGAILNERAQGQSIDLTQFFINPDTPFSMETVRRHLPIGAKAPLGNGERGKFDIFLAEKEDISMTLGYTFDGFPRQLSGSLTLMVNGQVLTTQALSRGQGSLTQTLPKTILTQGWNTIETRLNLSVSNGCIAPQEFPGEITWRPASSFIEGSSRALAHMAEPGTDGMYTIVLSGDNSQGTNPFVMAQEVGRRFENAAQNLVLWQQGQEFDVDNPDMVISLDGSQAPVGQFVPVLGPEDLINRFPLTQRDNQNLTQIGSSEYKTFAELGYSTEGWASPQHTTQMQFVLPDDFLGKNSAWARIQFNGIYPEDARNDARIDVQLNSEFAGTLVLPTGRGGRLEGWMLEIPLTHAQPGINTLSLNVFAPREDETICANAPIEPRAALFESSTLEMSSFGAGRPNSVASVFSNDQTIAVVARASTPELRQSVAQLMAQQADEDGLVRDVRIAGPNTINREDTVLWVGTPDDFTDGFLRDYNLDPNMVQEWQSQYRLRNDAQQDSPENMQQTPEQITLWARQREETSPNPITQFRDWIGNIFQAGFMGGAEIWPKPTDKAVLMARGDNTALFLYVQEGALVESVNNLIRQDITPGTASGNVAVDTGGLSRIRPASAWPSLDNLSPGNIRLAAADVMSAREWIYAFLVLLIATAVGLTSWLSLGGRKK